ncbi:amino acid ABC transporter permease/ATP-binding protein [Stenotrophomonas sp. S48]|uniref:amino acid ABC transporter permease/ATP-binding protein n=1 Tax=unclassified Stenotrophomonas TaxID=196198 RepID=UPI0019009BCC|nr:MULTISPECIES: amino acid ABC transporter permease/ATP-binding protein [unclassified Stenotrophomonas]MBK0027864.1 amino acid ABC transporter permease/ATP-binding protein [Stenotrophomonas sp. S48]MBK0050014.1 amino acid ABC transporter permease/ATP-binding protein [Stenotrophomonas sp. S49]
MSTPSTALEGLATRPAAAHALKIVPARHPLQVVGTLLALALILIGLQSVLGNPRWGWGTFAEWFFAKPVLEGLGRTLLLTALGTGLGFALGTLLALARVSGSPLLAALSWGYVWLFRSIPLLVLLLLLNNLGYLYSTIELGVPFTGISLFSYPTTQLIGVFTAAVLGLTLNQAAFSAEVIRGGILSVDHGQYEAAAALGLPRGRQVRRIILPQAMRSILPAAFNDVIGLAKSTSVVYVLALPELFYTVQVIYRRNLEVVPLLMVATVWYLVILTVLSLLQRRVEQRFARGQLQRERSSSRVSSVPRARAAVPGDGDRPRVAVPLEAGKGAAVTLHGVGKVFDEQVVLDDVSLDLRAGSVTVLIGPSGAGKSTLLRLINHLERADSGYVSVAGQLIGYRREGDTLYELPEREIRRRRAEVGMVFQGFNLFPHLTALENIMEAPIAVRGVSRVQAEQQARTLLQRVGLADKADAFPRQLSGGQQQRIAIARALALQPKVLLFDEPTSALDPELVAEVLSVIEELARSGTTLVIVTHELAFARRVADHVVMMDQGRVIEQGTPEALFERPRQQRTADFLAKTL